MNLEKYIKAVETLDPIHFTGRVTAVRGLLIESLGPKSVIGEMCYRDVEDRGKTQRIGAEVVGLAGNTVQLMSYGSTQGIDIGCTVTATGSVLQVAVGDELLGRVLNSTGHPMDGLGEIAADKRLPVIADATPPLERRPVGERIVTGVRAIDGFLGVAKGQRLGIFAGSGVGKSTLMSMIARNTNAEVNVIALEGERNREVNDFIHRDLGPEGMKRSVVVYATSNESSISRLRLAFVATTIAEYFRDKGKDVMLMVDSITRFAHAQREIGLAAGEPPAQRGYPPSVFEMLPKILERAGTSAVGSITAFYTVLVDGDDMDEPIADKVRGTLDGHIVLARKIAERRHYPPIDVLASISRLARRVASEDINEAAAKLGRAMAIYRDNEDMISAGAYQRGTSAEVDKAIDLHPKLEAFLIQGEFDQAPLEETEARLIELAALV
jgi:flagellum-specific ATP synthase